MAERYTFIEAHAPHPTREDLKGRRLASALLPQRTPTGERNPDIQHALDELEKRGLWRSYQTITVDSVAADIFLAYVDHELESGSG